MSFKIVIKLLISGLLFYIVLRTVEIEAFRNVIANVSPGMVLFVALGYFLGQVISVFKWWIILNSKRRTSMDGKSIPFIKAARAYFMGMFVNVLGVGTVGGDMTRAMLVSDSDHPKTICLATVVADRAHGLVVLLCIGILSVLFFGGNVLPFWLWLTLSVGGILVILGWFIGPEFLLYLVPKDHPFRVRVEQLSQSIPRDRGTLTSITILSLIFHLWQITLHQVMASALSVGISWPTLLVSIPFINVLSNLPISWQGLGVRENGYAFFLVPHSLLYEQAVAMGVIWLFAITSSGALGGLIAMLIRNKD